MTETIVLGGGCFWCINTCKTNFVQGLALIQQSDRVAIRHAHDAALQEQRRGMGRSLQQHQQ